MKEILFTSDQVVGPKVKGHEGGLLCIISPVTVCVVKYLSKAAPQSHGCWVCTTELSAHDPGEKEQNPYRNIILVHTVTLRHIGDGQQMSPSHVNSDWGPWLPGALVREEGWHLHAVYQGRRCGQCPYTSMCLPSLNDLIPGHVFCTLWAK